MDDLDLARIQFAFTSIYHFLFVPMTIGMSILVAILHTRWHRRGTPELKRVLRFFGGLMLISVAVGVVTGLVQEFQFGTNWSAYSRFVGDVFGAPLAMEGLLAFFLESTFLGLWLFGFGVLPRTVHLVTAWMVPLGACLSALFIIAANSWMQHPTGYTINPDTGRAELTSIGDLFTNRVFVWSYLHVLLVALIFGACLMLAVSAWQLRRSRNVAEFSSTAKLSIVVLFIAALLQMQVGGQLGINETTYQPMKIAAAEANWMTCQPCSFSLLQIGGWTADDPPTKIIEVPHLLSLLATGTWDGEVQGLTPLNEQYQQQFGDGDYIPPVFIQYWSMRVMAYGGALLVLFAAWGLWAMWRRKLPTSRVFLWVASWIMITPFFMATAGWLLTESGRQPWIVQGLMMTADGLSGSGTATQIIISLVIVATLYLSIGVVAAVLMIRHARRGIPDESSEADAADREHADDTTPSLTY
ncbi:cytochrome ubiquinol oxidase subunit I [Microbacterium sp. B2969]|uniref:Cytochrome ubiquinol oxidase subunit I n=1 Tax=Microbacterium alkaliflavum TaxID=3248839 RepID=A0ABW7Q2U7_9MICO